MARSHVTVVGGGLAGSEAAWQIARRGIPVRLFEMRPERETPVHKTGGLAELVCSNSFKSLELSNAHGLLKQELERLGSLILRAAKQTRVPAGAALAVDRGAFSARITAALEAESRIEVVRREVPSIPDDDLVILAVGPLVSDALARSIAKFTGQDYLYFFDAISPVVLADSIDRSVAFAASRRGKGEGADYLNCPMNAEQYERFVDELLAGEKVALHDVDNTPFFEGCLPIEEMARRGRQTLAFGPMKPVGLVDPRTGKRAHAVVQLRQDNLAAEHYSMVGFQTQLRWPEQKRIFKLIPGLERCEFVRLGQVHRNCYINSPKVLQPWLEARARRGLFFAGQISGVEGYTESAATGLLAGINAARLATGTDPASLPRETMLGALCHYIAGAEPKDYQPTNAAFGLLPEPQSKVRSKKEKRLARSREALSALDGWLAQTGEGVAAGSHA